MREHLLTKGDKVSNKLILHKRLRVFQFQLQTNVFLVKQLSELGSMITYQRILFLLRSVRLSFCLTTTIYF